jgi:hypothetical protein
VAAFGVLPAGAGPCRVPILVLASEGGGPSFKRFNAQPARDLSLKCGWMTLTLTLTGSGGEFRNDGTVQSSPKPARSTDLNTTSKFKS